MKRVWLLGIISVLVLVSGCSDKYTPSTSATPESIFKEACVKCHNPINGKVMALSPEMANTAAIIERIKKGKGFGMPAFPNLTGETAEGLAQYILDNSVTK